MVDSSQGPRIPQHCQDSCRTTGKVGTSPSTVLLQNHVASEFQEQQSDVLSHQAWDLTEATDLSNLRDDLHTPQE